VGGGPARLYVRDSRVESESRSVEHDRWAEPAAVGVASRQGHAVYGRDMGAPEAREGPSHRRVEGATSTGRVVLARKDDVISRHSQGLDFH